MAAGVSKSPTSGIGTGNAGGAPDGGLDAPGGALADPVGALDAPGGALAAPGGTLYEVIHRRRDVRGQFTGEPVPAGALERMLSAAHAAPSVGLTQPWDFVLVTQPSTRRAFFDHVQQERESFARSLPPPEAERFAGIKIDGIMEAGLCVVVTYDPARGAPHVLGRHAIADAGLYSVCLAIENFWLAATAEGMGMGWVSFYREQFLSDLVGLPKGIRPVAWICVGPVTHLEAVPDLERHGWRTRLPLDAVVHHEVWGRGATSPSGQLAREDRSGAG